MTSKKLQTTRRRIRLRQTDDCLKWYESEKQNLKKNDLTTVQFIDVMTEKFKIHVR